jgi:hypothetical protein
LHNDPEALEFPLRPASHSLDNDDKTPRHDEHGIVPTQSHVAPARPVTDLGVGAITVVMVDSMTCAAVRMNLHPPSNVRTGDSKTLRLAGKLVEDHHLGVSDDAVRAVASTDAARIGT